MKAAVTIHQFNALIVLVLLLIFTGISGVGKAFAATAYTENITYSSVLDDLQKDETFNTDNYPSIADDYSLQVFNIAESSTGELFVYVYQPSAKTKFLIATQINISRQDSNVADATFETYELTLVSSAGVFQKYRVEGFELEAADIRTYNISSISRRFYESLGDVPPKDETGNTAQTVAFNVGQLWLVFEHEGETVYKRKDVETISIEDKYVGFLRYDAGWAYITINRLDSHYLAFSASRQIDELLSAEVKYVETRMAQSYILGIESSLKEKWSESKTATVTAGVGGVTSKGLFSDDKQWYTIQRTIDFIEDNPDLTEEAKNNISDKEWVFRFCETEVEKMGDYKTSCEEYSNISNVTILRLEFNADGKYYNLGVVDNEQTGKDKPDNEEAFNFFDYVWNSLIKFFKGEADLLESIVAIAIIVIIVAVIPVLACVFPAFGNILVIILKAIGKGIYWLIRGVWWVISLPVKLILKRIRSKKDK